MDYHDHIFENQKVTLDGNSFTGCTITRCELTFSGIAAFSLKSSHISHCTYVFTGPALLTLRALHALYHGGEKENIERVIGEIRAPRPT